MPKRILIIEDEPTVQLLLAERLQHEGYTVGSESDGASGLESALREPFDLIILDIMLPGKSGLDVCLDLRQRRVPTPILMLTARDLTADQKAKLPKLAEALQLQTAAGQAGILLLIDTPVTGPPGILPIGLGPVDRCFLLTPATAIAPRR